MTKEEIATLLDETKCLACYGMSLPELLKLGLLSNISAAGSSSSQPLVYRALLTQTGTNAPVASVLENTLGGTPVWSYSVTGAYFVTLVGAFPLLKTIVNLKGICETDPDDHITQVSVMHPSDNVLGLNTTFIDVLANPWTIVFKNDVLASSSNTSIEILVYP